MKRNIIITGFMGTGKSVVAKELARKLKMEFIDMDRIIEERRGTSIADIFAGHGENYFRQQENKLVKAVERLEIDRKNVDAEKIENAIRAAKLREKMRDFELRQKEV